MLRTFKENMKIWTKTTEVEGLGEKKMRNAANKSNYTVELYGHKSDESEQVSLVRIYECDIDK